MHKHIHTDNRRMYVPTYIYIFFFIYVILLVDFGGEHIMFFIATVLNKLNDILSHVKDGS